jgi:hypothetical protein
MKATGTFERSVVPASGSLIMPAPGVDDDDAVSTTLARRSRSTRANTKNYTAGPHVFSPFSLADSGGLTGL